jgi:hypothetical protein
MRFQCIWPFWDRHLVNQVACAFLGREAYCQAYVALPRVCWWSNGRQVVDFCLAPVGVHGIHRWCLSFVVHGVGQRVVVQLQWCSCSVSVCWLLLWVGAFILTARCLPCLFLVYLLTRFILVFRSYYIIIFILINNRAPSSFKKYFSL